MKGARDSGIVEACWMTGATLDDRRRTQRAVIHGEMAWWSPQFLLDLRILIPVTGLGVGGLGDVFVHHHISVLQVCRENEFLE